MPTDRTSKETLLIEVLLSALDARESARASEAPLLLYLAEMLVQRAREELDIIKQVSEVATVPPPPCPGSSSP